MLPSKRNLNVYSIPNVKKFLSKFSNTLKHSNLRLLFHAFKRVKVGKTKPNLKELPYLLFSYYTHFLWKSKSDFKK